jgi:hypothetical protein
MATYDDFDGVYFTLQALKAYQDLEDVELVVVDTKKESCTDTANTCNSVGAKYFHRPDRVGTSASRNHVFEVATGKFVMCIDCHVLLVKDAVKKLKEYIYNNIDSKDLIQGPLLYDDQRNISTHFKPEWRGQMYGTWETDQRYLTEEKFEIPMQGLGLFCMRKEVWPKFNSNFRGFGGEEGYIQEKVRQNGGKAICLSWLKWIHRFGRPKGVPYPLDLKDRVVNYLIGWSELGMNYQEVLEFFNKSLNTNQLGDILNGFTKALGTPMSISPAKDYKISKVAYILDDEDSETYKNFNWEHPKISLQDKSFISAMNDFVSRDEYYCLIIKSGQKIDFETIQKIDEWIVVKQKILKIASLNEIEQNSLKRKNDFFSYRIADDIDIDESGSLIISKDFARIILNKNEGLKLSDVAKGNNISPFVLRKKEILYRVNPNLNHLDNISGNLQFCEIREIVWASKGRWCLDVSSTCLQTTLALCQKGLGIVRVYDFQNQDKETLKKELDVFGYANFIIADLDENIEAPENGGRVLLINYDNIPDYLKDFAYEKQSSFLRSGDILIIVNAEEEIREIFSDVVGYKINFISDNCLILLKE